LHDHVTLKVELIEIFDERRGLLDRRERGVLAEGSFERLDRGGATVCDAIRAKEFLGSPQRLGTAPSTLEGHDKHSPG